MALKKEHTLKFTWLSFKSSSFSTFYIASLYIMKYRIRFAGFLTHFSIMFSTSHSVKRTSFVAVSTDRRSSSDPRI